MIWKVTNAHRVLFGALFLIIAGLAGAGGSFLLSQMNIIQDNTFSEVLGKTVASTLPTTDTSNQAHFDTVLSPLGGTVEQTTPFRPPTREPDRFEISLVNGPTEAIVHSNLSFTWQISGLHFARSKTYGIIFSGRGFCRRFCQTSTGS